MSMGGRLFKADQKDSVIYNGIGIS